MHQAFADYSQRLASIQRNEWSKIQGRFEDIPFTESAGQMMRLIGQAIDRTSTDSHACALHGLAQEWFTRLDNIFERVDLDKDSISLDHYLPWSFVAHDQLWNLIPTTPSVNSSKSNNIPAENYFSDFVKLQHQGLTMCATSSFSVSSNGSV